MSNLSCPITVNLLVNQWSWLLGKLQPHEILRKFLCYLFRADIGLPINLCYYMESNACGKILNNLKYDLWKCKFCKYILSKIRDRSNYRVLNLSYFPWNKFSSRYKILFFLTVTKEITFCTTCDYDVPLN